MTQPERTPGMRAPQQARSQRTLERVLSAGAEVFAERSYEGLTVAEVCRRAGVSAGTLYTRFEGKDALIRAIHDHVMVQLSAEIAELYAPSEEWDRLPTLEFTERAVRLLVEHFRTHDRIIRAVVLRAAVDESLREVGASSVRAMADAFTSRTLDRANDFVHDDPEATVRSVFAMIFEAISWDVTFGSEFRAAGALGPDDLNDRLVSVARMMLLTTPPG